MLSMRQGVGRIKTKIRLGVPFVRRGKVFAYAYNKGKKTTRKLVEIQDLTPTDLKKGAKRAIVLSAMAAVTKALLEERSVFEPPK